MVMLKNTNCEICIILQSFSSRSSLGYLLEERNGPKRRNLGTVTDDDDVIFVRLHYRRHNRMDD